VDIPGHQTPAGGTLPPEVAISPLKPDIVIVDKTHKKVSIHELTCPAEHRIVTAYMLKD
jgi:ABC-type Fe3+-citrate transport system substrate-binding protein